MYYYFVSLGYLPLLWAVTVTRREKQKQVNNNKAYQLNKIQNKTKTNLTNNLLLKRKTKQLMTKQYTTITIPYQRSLKFARPHM